MRNLLPETLYRLSAAARSPAGESRPCEPVKAALPSRVQFILDRHRRKREARGAVSGAELEQSQQGERTSGARQGALVE